MRRSFSSFLAVLVLTTAACDGGSSTTEGSGGSGAQGGSGGSGAQGGGGSGGQPTGGGGTGGHEVVVGSIQIDVEPGVFCNNCFEMPVGEERGFVATVYGPDGAVLPDVPVTWSTGDATLASIDQDGKLKTLKKGLTSIEATAGGKTESRAFLVTPAIVSRIEITPPSATLAAVGEKVDFDAVAYDLKDQPIRDAELIWFTSNDVVAGIAPDGLATSTAQGTVAVQVTTDGGGWGAAMLVVASVLPATPPFQLVQVSAGGNHSCGLDADGQAYCWGWNYYGQLGDGGVLPPLEHQPTPKPVIGGKKFTKVVAGGTETCALDAAGAAFCWGSQESGTLGNGKTEPGAVTEPTPVLGGHSFTTLAMGGGQACGITTAGALYCWGLNAWDAVGDGSGVNAAEPVAIAEGTQFIDVTAGLYSTCALRADGHALCWGQDDFGQLGQGDAVGGSSPMPIEVTGGHVFTRIDMFGSFVCALDDGGAIWCWGRNDTSQIGEPEDLVGISTPTKIESPLSFIDVAAGAFHACGLASDGHAVCWGDDSYGQLGDGSVVRSVTPVDVVGDLTFADIDSGPHHMCGRTSTNGAFCWGTASTGQIGSGFGGTDALFSVTPWPVAMPAQ